MTDIEYGVHVIDSAPGSVVRIEPAGSLGRAKHRRDYFANMDKTRKTYGIAARIVYRMDGGEWMPWEGE